jgi:hypothetical protein
MPSAATTTERATTSRKERLRKFLRFNLRSALLLTAILCGFLAWAARDIHRAYRGTRLAVEARLLGGRVTADVSRQPSTFSAASWLGLLDERLACPITHLDLTSPQVTDDDIERLMPMLRANPELEWVRLSNTSVGDRTVELLAGQPRLKYLYLDGTRVSDGAGMALQRLTELHALDLTNTRITDAVAPSVADLPRLEILSLASTALTDRGLAELQRSQGLIDLNLTRTHVTDAGVLPLQRQHPKLRVWIHAGQPLPTLDAMAAATSLSLADPFFNDDSLARMEHCPLVTQLQLSGSSVTAEGLKRMPCRSQIQRLSWGTASDSSLAGIADWENLFDLYLRATPITDDGLRHLSGLTELRFLDLDATRIDGSGLSHLAGLQNLVRLNLTATAVTDDTLRNLPPLPELQAVGLAETAVTDNGLVHLQSFPKLWAVSTWSSPISDAGLQFFRERPQQRFLPDPHTYKNVLAEKVPTP